MSRVDLSSAGFSKVLLPNGMLQTDSALNTTLQTVKDNVGNSSTLLLSTVDAQFNSTLRIHTDSSELLDIEDTGANNRFNINRVVQQINLDFASKPTDLTTIVGAIRTAQDGVNLSNALYFKENGQATFTERLGIESDSSVATQTSSVIQATTTNANLVLNPNGTGAIVASIPDGTTTGGNARGNNAIDLQTGTRDNSNQVASGTQSAIINGTRNRANNTQASVINGDLNLSSGSQSFIGNGSGNTASGQRSFIGNGFLNNATSDYATISGGQSNTASTNTHATVVGGNGNTASGQYSVAGGQTNTASGGYSLSLGKSNTASSSGCISLGESNNSSNSNCIAIGRSNTSNATYSIAIGNSCTSSNIVSFATGNGGYSWLYNQYSYGNYISAIGDCQYSLLQPFRVATLSSASTTVLYLDGSSLLITSITANRAYNVQVNWVAVVTAITGTATGVTVGDTITQVQTLGFKKVGGISSLVGTANTLSTNANTSMTTALMTYTAGASQELALTFTAPTFAGGGTVTCRVVARVELTEVAW